MRKSVRLIIYSTALLVSGLIFAVHGLGAQQPFAVTIKTAETAYKVGSPVRLEIELTNTSDQPMRVGKAVSDANAELSGFDISVLNDKGNPPPETDYLRGMHGEGSGFTWTGSFYSATIAPGESFRDGMIVNKFYDMSQPGKYTIQVQRTDKENKRVIKSNTITVTIAP